MLDLMNNARLGVAAQAIGVAEAAYRAARAYAAQRVQFGAPIIQQPLVKSMLTLMAINIQAARALLYRTCALIDLTRRARARYLRVRPRRRPTRSATALQDELERNMQLIRFFTPALQVLRDRDQQRRDAARASRCTAASATWPSRRAGHYHSDSIITTIYEGTSEIQASFALEGDEQGRAVRRAGGDRARSSSRCARSTPSWSSRCATASSGSRESLPALMGDPQYALLNAKRVCEMVIDVVVAAELLLPGATLARSKLELAASFIHRRMLAVEMNARRISSGDASRIEALRPDPGSHLRDAVIGEPAISDERDRPARPWRGWRD